jgi:hypothetical protein
MQHFIASNDENSLGRTEGNGIRPDRREENMRHVLYALLGASRFTGLTARRHEIASLNRAKRWWNEP